MKAKEWMTRDVETCGPETSMNEAAHKMWAGDNESCPSRSARPFRAAPLSPRWQVDGGWVLVEGRDAQRAGMSDSVIGPAANRNNAWIATRLEEVAELLEAQDANPFRVLAYRRAAAALRREPRPAGALLAAGGPAALRALEGVGESLAHSIESLVRTGRMPLLERLRSGSGPEDVLATVAGIGPELARRIHEQLGVDSLYALEAAAHDGRLASVPGMGAVRVRAVREALAGRFQRRPGPVGAHAVELEQDPPVAELLDVDREYRERGAAGTLVCIAPRRFNPARERWLPVLHTEREGHQYTALFSNTARAHELGATRDWVVIYRDDHDSGGQWTVVTSHRGPLSGRRVVRGREAACAELYRQGERTVAP